MSSACWHCAHICELLCTVKVKSALGTVNTKMYFSKCCTKFSMSARFINLNKYNKIKVIFRLFVLLNV